MALSLTRLKILIQNMTRCTKNDSKTDFFSKSVIQFFFWMKTIFSATSLQECTKSQHWRLYGVYWPAKLFFESPFSKNSWFSNNTFFIGNWCVVNILTQVLTQCWKSKQKSISWKKFESKTDNCKSPDPKTDELFRVGLN